jgi:SNF2 family DNA or RNA helicase
METPLSFNGVLQEFQQKVLDWTLPRHGGVLALDMGLGKTPISIAVICAKQYHRTLVVMPIALMAQWEQELVRFTNLPRRLICPYQGRNRKDYNLDKFRVVLTTYDVLRYEMCVPDTKLSQFVSSLSCVILDEGHIIRNQKTAGFKECMKFAEVQDKWVLTGTPIHNSYDDVTSLYSFIGADPALSRTPEEARRNYYYRLMKGDVCTDLPEKHLHAHHLTFDESHLKEYLSLYQQTKKIYVEIQKNPMTFNPNCLLEKILRLRQCCNHSDASLSQTQAQIKDNRHYFDASSKFVKILEVVKAVPQDEKVIIFSQWRHSLELLSDYLLKNGYKSLCYNGEMGIEERNAQIKVFGASSFKILLCTIQTAGVGLNLVMANHVILMDPWWNSAMEEQAIDRVYRIGQKRPVQVHRMYMMASIEEWIEQMKNEKRKIDLLFHEKNDIYNVDSSSLMSLFHLFV